MFRAIAENMRRDTAFSLCVILFGVPVAVLSVAGVVILVIDAIKQ